MHGHHIDTGNEFSFHQKDTTRQFD